MKVSIVGTIGKSKKLPTGFAFSGPSSRQMDDPVKLRFAYPSRINDPAQAAALRSYCLWVFRNKVVRVDNGSGASRAEIATRIKHKVLSGEKAFVKMARTVELFEKLEAGRSPRRVAIADEVRVLVWRRDEGRCVTCGSQERLEFDHIIPVEKGGSSTARNIQLLCEKCNRQKGTSI